MFEQLKSKFVRDKDRMKLPRSAQECIPVERIWMDGIWFADGKYSKCWRFEDINYEIASQEDKEAMFWNYAALLNSFDSNANTKITICNRKINKKAFEESVLTKLNGDELDVFRKEYNEMLYDKITSTSNSIVQERYITVSAPAKDIEEARSYFNRMTAELSGHLGKLSSACVPLNSTERLRIFHDFYRAGEEDHFSMDLKTMIRQGKSFRDHICPDTFEFKSDHFVMGDRYGRVLFVKDFANFLKDRFLFDLYSLNRNMFLSIDMVPVPTEKAVRDVQNKILGIETNITNWQRRQNQNNNFSAALPYDLELQRNETKEFLDDIVSRDQRMMYALVTLVHTADTKEQLDADTKRLTATARNRACQLSVLKFQQLEGLNTALPAGTRYIHAIRTFTTESLAALMPFCAQEIMHPGGIYAGVNTITGNLIIVDRTGLINGNGFVCGVSGSGKSFYVKEYVIAVKLKRPQDEILILDPHNEYAPLILALGGRAINFSPSSPHHINALDLSEGYGSGVNPLIAKSEFVLSLVERVVGSGKLDAADKSLIDESLTRIYGKYLASNYTANPPTLAELYEDLTKYKTPRADNLALAIRMISTGNLNMFAHQTNIDVDNKLISFGIRDLGSQMQEIGETVLFDAIRNRVARNSERGIRTHVIVDEMHIFFTHEYSAQFFAGVWKQFRKYGALATGITQNVEDCMKSVTGRTLLANSEYLAMLNQAPTDRMELARLLNISEEQLSHITNSGVGKGLLKCGNAIVPFLDEFPKNTSLYKLMTTRMEDDGS